MAKTPTPTAFGERANLDQESRVIVHQGATTTQLAAMFRMKPSDVLGKLAGLEPVGTGRHGTPIYQVGEAAKRLVKPDGDFAA